jgi:hypothetical protein
MKSEIINPKTKFLLGAGLNVLHQESREWKDILEFWKSETQFFANLLAKKEATDSVYGNILNDLDKIHENLFEYLYQDIISHEKLLSKLVKGEKGLSDGNYREAHGKLGERMKLLTNDFKNFKQMVFGYVKKL